MTSSKFGAALWVIVSLAVGNASAGILGGRPVESNDPVAQMTVRLSDPNDYGTCSGVIYDNDLIITAAHCTPMNTIHFGLTQNQSEVRASAACLRHPNFAMNFTGPNRWDIALIRFEGGLPAGYRKATILPANVDLKIGDTATVAGYGQDDNMQSNTLNEVQVTISHLDDFSPIEVVFDQTQHKGACHGDSGGPAFYLYNGVLNLIGITNGPYDDLECYGQGVYARVPAHAAWLEKAAAILRATPLQDEPTRCVAAPPL